LFHARSFNLSGTFGNYFYLEIAPEARRRQEARTFNSLVKRSRMTGFSWGVHPIHFSTRKSYSFHHGLSHADES
jgi:hypothetical protein